VALPLLSVGTVTWALFIYFATRRRSLEGGTDGEVAGDADITVAGPEAAAGAVPPPEPPR
jgi:hypothetical protein